MLIPFQAIFNAIPKYIWALIIMGLVIIYLTNRLLLKNDELVTLQAEIRTLSGLNSEKVVEITTVRVDTVYVTQKEITTRIDSVKVIGDTLIIKPFEDYYIKGHLRYKWYNQYLTSDLTYTPKFPLYITQTVLDERTITKYVSVPLYRDRKPTVKFGAGLGYYDGLMPLGSVGYGDKRIIGGYSKDRWLVGLLVDF